MNMGLVDEPLLVIGRHTEEAPVDVSAIARDLGISVSHDVMDAEVAGKIVRDRKSPSGYSVYVNARDPARRQRFTLAHEIAHYVLHRDLIGDGLIDDGMYRSKLGGLYESQANRMAADILMPPGLIRAYYRGGMKSLVDLGETFNVSEGAIRIRLSELKLAP